MIKTILIIYFSIGFSTGLIMFIGKQLSLNILKKHKNAKRKDIEEFIEYDKKKKGIITSYEDKEREYNEFLYSQGVKGFIDGVLYIIIWPIYLYLIIVGMCKSLYKMIKYCKNEGTFEEFLKQEGLLEEEE